MGANGNGKASTGPPPADAAFADAWRDDRRYLLGQAAKMLRDQPAAEDVVQDAFDRLAQMPIAEIDDVRGWLAVVVRRLCLNRLRSAYTRREAVSGSAPAEPGPPHVGGAAVDPADRVTLDDQVRLALSVVLDRLSPAERTAFVLHDVFGFPYAAVGEIVGRTATACRQLASRARRSIRADAEANAAGAGRRARSVAAGEAEHRAVTERFIAACAGGDMAALMAVLDPDVVGEATMLGGGVVIETAGRVEVATRLMSMFGPGTETTLTPISVEGQDGIVFLIHGRVGAVATLRETNGVIDHIHAFIQPPG